MTLDDYIQSLKNHKDLASDIVCHKILPEKEAVFASSAPLLEHDLSSVLNQLGIHRLYHHQQKAIDQIKKGIHTVISAPTASGKSLIYNLPVIDSLLKDPDSHALYLFPLKALARDQLDTIEHLLMAANGKNIKTPRLTAAVYDGDITAYRKIKIRRSPPHVLLSNPEMLHLSMLAHHSLWESFFKGLQYVIIDEVHTYRGVMGTNMSLVFRRLMRICQLYGADPIFVFCSATIANPGSLCSKLTGLYVQTIDESGSPAGKKEVILMRGLEGAARTAIALLHSAVHRNLRTICYTQSKKMTELIAIWASRRARGFSEKISAYRAGFLPEERREIEGKLSSGELLAVVSTSALELGIDIGNLDICILVGYPGTIMSTWQRAGRVGRDGKDSALILIAHEDALDQFFIQHPDVFFNMPPEKAIINPKNPVISKRHVECAAAELSLEHTESFLGQAGIQDAVSDLEYSGRLLRSRKGDMWYAARKFPHRDVSLRGAGKSLPIFLENTKKVMGEIDKHRSYFETHEGAVYLHKGFSYIITRFDHEKNIIEAQQRDVSYYTKARSFKKTAIIKQLKKKNVNGTWVGFGVLKITEQVTGYDRRLVSNQKSIGIVSLDLPELTFETQGLWIEVPDLVRNAIKAARMHFMGGIHALEHAAIGIMPLLVMTDRNDLGGISIPCHSQTGKAAIFIYDGVPGGLGLSFQAFQDADMLLNRTHEAIRSCGCETGCPACVHSPKCGSGNRPIDKYSALKILEMMNGLPQTGERFKNIVVPGPAPSKPRVAITDELLPQQEEDIHFTVLDIETRRSAKEVGGWHKARYMGVSCAVLYDSKQDQFNEYRQEDVPQLCHDLKQSDLVIGFNIIGFDYKVLTGLSDFDFYSLPTLDILIKVHERLGYRLSLDHLASQTMGSKKSADGLMALKWWKEGKLEKIAKYCRQDVKITRDLYLYGKKYNYLVFKNKADQQVRVPVFF